MAERLAEEIIGVVEPVADLAFVTDGFRDGGGELWGDDLVGVGGRFFERLNDGLCGFHGRWVITSAAPGRPGGRRVQPDAGLRAIAPRTVPVQ